MKNFKRFIACCALVFVVFGTVPACADVKDSIKDAAIDWVVGKALDAVWGYITKTPLDELKEKAENGDRQSQYVLGLLYLHGDSAKKVSKNYSEALRWMRRAAERK